MTDPELIQRMVDSANLAEFRDDDFLSDYDRGVINGLKAYAWWKDGVQYVGTCGTTLEKAIQDFMNGVYP